MTHSQLTLALAWAEHKILELGGVAACGAVSPVRGQWCTRYRGHDGAHVAYGLDRDPLDVWEEPPPPSRQVLQRLLALLTPWPPRE